MRVYPVLLTLVGLLPIETQSLADTLIPIERTVHSVLDRWPADQTMIHELHRNDRESFAIAKNLDQRLRSFRRNGDCGRCWLQRAHCICDQMPSLESNNQEEETTPLLEGLVRRMFVLTHHKEICLLVDTAKLIAASLPCTSSLVVGGIGPQFQVCMDEMLQCIQHEPSACIVLYPSEDAQTYTEIINGAGGRSRAVPKNGWNVIVLDGTWEQARKMYHRYHRASNVGDNGALLHVKLSDASLASILRAEGNDVNTSSHGMQLRRHSEQWRQISTLTATRLLLTEMAPGRSCTV